MFSVPQGQNGTITIASSAGDEFSLATTTGVTGNPRLDADLDILTDVAGDDGYATRSSFLPAGVTFNNHYPFKDEISDFVLFDIADFDNTEGPLHDYNADDGTTAVAANSTGEEKVYQVSFTGFTQMHMDAYMMENNTNLVASWDINPGSHDATAFEEGTVPIPAPSAFLLGLMGMGMVSAVRRRFS